MKAYRIILLVIALLCVGACSRTNDDSYNSVESFENSSESASTSIEEVQYVIQFNLAVEIDGMTLYLSVEDLSVPNENEAHIHTIENKTVKDGDTLSFLKKPTILNDKSSRYYFDCWEASDGENVVRVTEDTILSQTILKKGVITIWPTVKKVAHTNNYS